MEKTFINAESAQTVFLEAFEVVKGLPLWSWLLLPLFLAVLQRN